MSLNIYGLLISAASLLGYLLASFRAKKEGITQSHIDNLFIFCSIGAVVGARAYHVIDKWELYSDNWVRALYIWQGGIGIFGALVGGFVALVWYARKNNLDYKKIGDIIAPSVLLGQSVGRLGNYFNLEGFGQPTSLPTKIFIPIEKRPDMYSSFEYFHPTFFYESLLCFVAFLILLVVSRYTSKSPGILLGSYLISYGLIRIVTEAFRIDTAAIFDIRIAYLFSVGFVIYGVNLIWPKLKSS